MMGASRRFRSDDGVMLMDLLKKRTLNINAWNKHTTNPTQRHEEKLGLLSIAMHSLFNDVNVYVLL